MQTECCSNWICNDQHMYKVNSFIKNSCARNHDRYTLCGSHYQNEHKGDWKKCKKCQAEYNKVIYDDLATNKHNFEKLKVEKEELWCRNCSFTSYNLSEYCFKYYLF
jgi:hypothetical protein